MNTFCHMKDSLCFTFSQNLVTKVAFLPLSENEISSETEILHGVDDLFYPQHLHHQQKCCFSRGLLGRAVGVSYACRLFSMCDTDNWATSSRRRGQIESICTISATWLDRKIQSKSARLAQECMSGMYSLDSIECTHYLSWEAIARPLLLSIK